MWVCTGCICFQDMLSITRSLMSANRPLYTSITQKLTTAFDPVRLTVNDDSHMHRGHAGVQGAATTETHFSVEIVSELFRNVNRVQRQRLVNNVLEDEFKKGLHALALTCKTPEEA